MIASIIIIKLIPEIVKKYEREQKKNQGAASLVPGEIIIHL